MGIREEHERIRAIGEEIRIDAAIEPLREALSKIAYEPMTEAGCVSVARKALHQLRNSKEQ